MPTRSKRHTALLARTAAAWLVALLLFFPWAGWC